MPESIPAKPCTKCGQVKPLDEFHRNAASPDGYQSRCKPCRAVACRESREANPGTWRTYYDANQEQFRQRRRDYYAANREAVLAVNNDYREANRDQIREQKREYYWSDPEEMRRRGREWREANPELDARIQRERHEARRAEVFGHYGTACACCGSTENLQIDHVEGGGRAHRTELFGYHRGSTGQWYNWIIREGFPDELQVLCRDCNLSKGETEGCRIDHSTV